MKTIVTRTWPALAALAVATAGSVLAAPAAHAAQSEQPLTCSGQDIVVRTPDNHSSGRGGWSAAKIVDGGSGTLIPTSFEFSVYDDSLGQLIFSDSLLSGGGHGHANQETFTCTQSATGTLGDVLEPGDEVPPGASLEDQVTLTFTVSAFRRP